MTVDFLLVCLSWLVLFVSALGLIGQSVIYFGGAKDQQKASIPIILFMFAVFMVAADNLGFRP